MKGAKKGKIEGERLVWGRKDKEKRKRGKGERMRAKGRERSM